ncbi:MAG: transcription elongation factor GreA, partial [Clostridia bacterium]|nr:transcription elongation factor GreA [Clostridia bacterium]
MAEAVLLTKAGKKELEDRLEYLKTERRKEITEAIAVARSFG